MKLKARNIYQELKNFSNRKFLILIIPILLSACTPSETDIDTKSNEYIDISGFFKEEANRLNDLNASLEKSLNNGASNEIVLRTDVDWTEELNPFIDIDLNKPAYKNGYKIDTININSGYQIKYSSIDESLELKSVSIDFIKEQIQKIIVIHKKDNIYYLSKEELIYETGKSFHIKVRNELKTGKPIQFGITGTIISSNP